MRGLRHIKTACKRERSIPPDSSPYSMRSHLNARQSQPVKSKSPYKAHVAPPPKQELLTVQRFQWVSARLSQKGNFTHIRAGIPLADEPIQTAVRRYLGNSRNSQWCVICCRMFITLPCICYSDTSRW